MGMLLCMAGMIRPLVGEHRTIRVRPALVPQYLGRAVSWAM